MNGGRSRVLRISHAPLCYCAWRRVEIASELPRRFCTGVEHGIATTPDGQIFFASLVGTTSDTKCPNLNRIGCVKHNLIS